MTWDSRLKDLQKLHYLCAEKKLTVYMLWFINLFWFENLIFMVILPVKYC